jgi:hypothetical protein
MEIWTPGKLNEVAGRATTAAVRIVDRLEAAAIDPPEAPAPDDAKAWGQYLDDEHRTADQWGFYGTSAAVQVLALKQRAMATDPEADVRLIELALKQLPADPQTTDPRFDQKRTKGDFENIIKLAFIADALLPGSDYVEADPPPPVIAEIIDRAVDGQFWSSRLPDDPDRRTKERAFPTAYVLLVLQRFRAARTSPAYNNARIWLAERVIQDELLDRPAMNALAGLALLDRNETDQARPGVVANALGRCQERVLTWARTQNNIVIDRPVFFGFSLRNRNDYAFLHPEVLAAFFLLRRGNPPTGRAFVLRVMRYLSDNIVNAGGFIGQNGVMSTVDQMWAMRLITEFRAIRDSPGGRARLLPVRDQRALLQDSRSRLLAIVAAILAAGGIVLATSDSWKSAVGAWAVAVLMLFANVFAIPVKDD